MTAYINSYVASKGNSKGQTVHNVALGLSDNVFHDVRLNPRACAALLAERSNPAFWVMVSQVAASVPPIDPPAPIVPPTQTPVSDPVPSLRTTVDAIQDRAANHAQQTANPAPAPKVISPVVATPDDSVPSDLLEAAKAAKVKGAHLFKSASKLRAFMQANRPGAPLSISATPAPVVPPVVNPPVNPPVVPVVSKSSPAAPKVATVPMGNAPRVITVALGENDAMYVIMSDGTYRVMNQVAVA